MATNQKPISLIPTWITAGIATVVFFMTVWKFFIRNPFEDKLKEFNRRKEDLKGSRETTETRMHKQLETPGKVVQADVKKWMDAAGVEISGDQSFEYLGRGILYYLFPQDGIVKERTAELIKTFEDGEKFRHMPVLVDDDASLEWFTEQKEKLKVRLRDVEGRLSLQLLVPGKIETDIVQVWRGKAKDTTGQAARDIENKFNDVPQEAELPNLVKQKIREMKELCNEGDQLLTESLVGDDPSASAPPMLTSELQGNHDVKEEIWGHLMGDETAKIGVWGMGGVGKTTIMMHVYNQLLKEPKFKKVVWVTVSHTFDVHRIQQEIASSLQKDVILPNQQGGILRAAALSKILEMHKPYVLILDDAWETFELHKVGIPKIPGCKLVLTTRSKEVVHTRDCKLVQVNILSTEDSLQLFKDTAGVKALPDDEGTLEKMVGECGGLPLAIKAVAASMKETSDPRLWRAALKKLKEGSINVAGAEYDPFQALKFSYDRVGNQNTKHCFLHCVLYPEDEMILTKNLIDCWIDGELIDVDGTLRGMKDEGHSILNKLVGNCLLEPCGIDFVRMHDLMRTMALRITRTSSPRFLVKACVGLTELPEEHEWKEDLLKVSLMSNYTVDIPPSMPSPRCPILTTLLLSKNNLSTIPENFFEHMPELKVLDLSCNMKLRSLPSSVSKLVKLTTLLLQSCNSLKELPSLSNLTLLKKLDLLEAGLEEVPHGLEMLLNLKYLDIRRFGGDRVPTGWKRLVSEILSNLSKLQHLGLPLRVPVEGGQLSGIWPKLENFYGSFGTWRDMTIIINKRQKRLYDYNIYVGDPDEEELSLDPTDWFELKCIRCFGIDICGEPGLIPSDVQGLVISRCNDVRSLNSISGFQLSKLMRLALGELENLSGLFDSEARSPPLAVFSSLEEISITDCHNIKKLFPTTLQYLPNLKNILVWNCSQLEEIVVASSEEGGRVIHAKLEYLSLDHLPMLSSISSLTDASIFDSLKELRISECPKLEYVFGGQFKFNSLQSLEYMELEVLQSLKSIFHEEADESIAFGAPLLGISFPLRVLQVKHCPQLKNIFPHAVQVGSFQNIEKIEVKGCGRLKEIMAASSETQEDQSEPILPKLEALFLIELPVLRRICSALLVPDSLQQLTIEDCPNLSGECLFGLHVELPRTLYSLSLIGVRNLESVFDDEASDSRAFWRLPPAATTSFALERISVVDCPQLKNIFTHEGLLDHFQNIRSIDVKGSDELEEMISSKSVEEHSALFLLQTVTRLPTLTRLQLRNLPNLKRVCNATSALICDSLQYLTVSGCTDLKRFPLHLPLSHNGQLSPLSDLSKIELSDKEKGWWESMEWDQPNAKDVLRPLCIFTILRGEMQNSSESRSSNIEDDGVDFSSWRRLLWD